MKLLLWLHQGIGAKLKKRIATTINMQFKGGKNILKYNVGGLLVSSELAMSKGNNFGEKICFLKLSL